MNVLIACEYSGTVRDAFGNAGFNAWSCDLLPAESELSKAFHIQEDIKMLLNPLTYKRFLLGKNKSDWNFTEMQLRFMTHRQKVAMGLPNKWDLLIGFPPCTYLSFAYTGSERYSIERLQKKIEAYQFFLDLWNAPVEHICLENPQGYIHSGLLPYSQRIEPYYFGHDYRKRTCLWLKNLPLLKYTLEDNLFERKTAGAPTKKFLDIGRKGVKYNKEDFVLPAYSTGKERSKFHSRIAEAMAEQWGEYLKSKKL